MEDAIKIYIRPYPVPKFVLLPSLDAQISEFWRIQRPWQHENWELLTELEGRIVMCKEGRFLIQSVAGVELGEEIKLARLLT